MPMRIQHIYIYMASTVVVILLLSHCLLLLPLFCVWSLCCAVLSVVYSFAIISLGEERVGCFTLNAF